MVAVNVFRKLGAKMMLLKVGGALLNCVLASFRGEHPNKVVVEAHEV